MQTAIWSSSLWMVPIFILCVNHHIPGMLCIEDVGLSTVGGTCWVHAGEAHERSDPPLRPQNYCQRKVLMSLGARAGQFLSTGKLGGMTTSSGSQVGRFPFHRCSTGLRCRLATTLVVLDRKEMPTYHVVLLTLLCLEGKEPLSSGPFPQG